MADQPLRSQGPNSPPVGTSPTRKDAQQAPLTPLQHLLADAGPLRSDGNDKFFGMLNVGNVYKNVYAN